MHLVIDLQGAQIQTSTEVRNNILLLTQMIIKTGGTHDITIILSGLLPNSIEPIRRTFNTLLPNQNILVWHAPDSLKNSNKNYFRETAKLIREAFLAKLSPDVLLLINPFSNTTDNEIISIGKISASYPIAAILIDSYLPIGNQSNPKTDEHSNEKINLLITYPNLGKEKLTNQLSNSEIERIILNNFCPSPLFLDSINHSETEIPSIDLLPHTVKEQYYKHTLCIIKALNQLHEKFDKISNISSSQCNGTNIKLAYVSQLPPIRSGIADYAMELLVELTNYYEIDIISNQETFDIPQEIKNKVNIQTVDWFNIHFNNYDRVLYQIGNHPCHTYMLDLLQKTNGIVIMHDFFLPGLTSNNESMWTNSLYHSHGYQAAMKLFESPESPAYCNWQYPCNLEILQHATGIIVHSQNTIDMAKQWYGYHTKDLCSTLPMLRPTPTKVIRADARRALNIPDDALLICSFGFITETKQNHRLVKAISLLEATDKSNIYLVFVGEADLNSAYGSNLANLVNKTVKNAQVHIKITGWLDPLKYCCYLSAADIAVQLRAFSRGESSASVLDCLNYGIATIINANGAMAEIPSNCVYTLEDDFKDQDLVEAIQTLLENKKKRLVLANQAKTNINHNHNPAFVTKKLFEKIENFYHQRKSYLQMLLNSLTSNTDYQSNHLQPLATCIAKSFPRTPYTKQLLVDISAIVMADLKTGIQRVIRAQLVELIKSPPRGFRIEPVYLTYEGGWHYRYARQYISRLLEFPLNLQDEYIDIYPGDLLYCADLAAGIHTQAHQEGAFNSLKASGVIISTLVYDLLPIYHPEYFPPHTQNGHAAWLDAITDFSDTIICISKTVEKDLRNWLEQHKPEKLNSINITHNHLGANIIASAPSQGLPKNASSIIQRIQENPSFVMVGTIEPRKGHLQTLQAFEILWQQGEDLNLIIIGKKGWNGSSRDPRRNISKLLHKITRHKKNGKNLFWLESISDEFLKQIYSTSSCLICASEAEGFGLPLIEAAKHKLPIISRDIPVFREVAENSSFYFENDYDAQTLADSILNWLSLFKQGKHPKSDDMKWITWEQNVAQLKNILL